MATLSSISNVVVHRDTQLSSFTSGTTSAPTVSSARLTSTQSNELGKVLNQLEELEAALKSSGKYTTQRQIESVSASASAQSSVLAVNADSAFGQAKSANLVVNGGFEEDVVNRAFGLVRNSTAWSNSADGVYEVWRNVSRMPSIQGNQHVEIDVRGQNDTLDQTVSTEPGQIYDFSFAYAARLEESAESNTVEVYFDGELLDTIGESGENKSALDWDVYSFTVEATSLESKISFRETSTNGQGILLDAVSLTESSNTVGASSVSDISTATDQVVLSDASIESGSIAINNQAIDINVESDSLQDIVSSINAAATGVTATMVSAGVNADNQNLFTIELTGDNGGFLLEDNGTGLIAAMGLQEGVHGVVYETVADPGKKARGYRAANALEAIQKSLETLFAGESTNGSSSLKSSLSTIFSDLAERNSTSKLSAFGLDFTEFDEGYLDISQQSRKRFAKAVYEDDNRLEKLLLKSFGNNDNGLIDTIRNTIKAELKSNSGSIGSIINTFA